jgi:uncharacterized caspase-like protein
VTITEQVPETEPIPTLDDDTAKRLLNELIEARSEKENIEHKIKALSHQLATVLPKTSMFTDTTGARFRVSSYTPQDKFVVNLPLLARIDAEAYDVLTKRVQARAEDIRTALKTGRIKPETASQVIDLKPSAPIVSVQLLDDIDEETDQ